MLYSFWYVQYLKDSKCSMKVFLMMKAVTILKALTFFKGIKDENSVIKSSMFFPSYFAKKYM